MFAHPLVTLTPLIVLCVCSIGFLTNFGAFALILISFGFLPFVTISHSFGCFRLTSTYPPTTYLPFAFSWVLVHHNTSNCIGLLLLIPSIAFPT